MSTESKSWQLVETQAALDELLAKAMTSEVVMVDTEFMRRNTFFPQVALVQLCFEANGVSADTAWLVDPLLVENTDRLIELLRAPHITKVLHSASEDLEVFQHWLGVVPQPLFDTQRAAALLDMGFGMGYRGLVQEISQIDLPKGETQSNWLQRPLTQSQCEYAALDVTCLFPVWRELNQRCIAQDKLDWVLSDSDDAISLMGASSALFYKRIKGAWKLDSQQLAVLAGVCEWREETARERNKPRNWIIDDKACLALAQVLPSSVAQMKEQIDLPEPALRRYAEELIGLIATILADSERIHLEPLPQPLDASQRDAVKQLKKHARKIAVELGVAPEALLQSKDYEILLREVSQALKLQPIHWLGWRQHRVVEPLRNKLRT